MVSIFRVYYGVCYNLYTKLPLKQGKGCAIKEKNFIFSDGEVSTAIKLEGRG